MLLLILSFIRKIKPRILFCVALCTFAFYCFYAFKERYVAQGKNFVYQEWKLAELTREKIENDARLVEQKMQSAINESIKKDHANEISKIHTSYSASKRLRIPASACNQSAEATSANASDATIATTITLPEPIESNLWDLMMEADIMLANYRALQEFVKLNKLAQ
jgi:hypothetical protein